MKAIIFNDIKRTLRSKRFWICAGLIVISAILNFITEFLFSRNKPKGALELFIVGNIMGNPIMNMIAPFIPAFIIGPAVTGDLKSGDFKEQMKKFGAKRYLAARSLSSFIAGGGVFIISFMVVLAGCFFYHPAVQEIRYVLLGLFKEIYYASVPLYILLFILYSALFGAVFSFFSFGIGLAARNEMSAMALPGIIYHGAMIVWPLFNNSLVSWLNILLPQFAYEFNVYSVSFEPETEKAIKLGVILLVSAALVITSFGRLKKDGPMEIAEGCRDNGG